MTKYTAFIDYVKKIQNYSEALGVIFWDMRTGAPKKGLSQRAEVIGTLSEELFALQTSEELGKLLDEVGKDLANVDFVTKRLFEEVKKGYDESKKVPVDEYKEYMILKSKAENAWEEAKKQQTSNCFCHT